MFRQPSELIRIKGVLGKAKRYAEFVQQFYQFANLSAQGAPRFSLRWRDRYPCLTDRTSRTDFDRHYIYHTAWAARILKQTLPKEHVDISSALYFVTLLSAFMKVRHFDYRPPRIHLPGLEVGSVNLTSMPFEDHSLESVSCMHVIEHVGLGRYGDPLDPQGDLKAMAEIERVAAPGGCLLIVVPVGRPRICFNAHRVYSYEQIRSGFPNCDLIQIALIPDQEVTGGLVIDPAVSIINSQHYGCGCFWFCRKGE